MELIIYTCAAIAGMILLISAVRIFISPIRILLKLLLNASLGFAGLILFDLFGAYINISIGVNLINAFILGLLGIPGLALLLLVKWLCGL